MKSFSVKDCKDVLIVVCTLSVERTKGLMSRSGEGRVCIDVLVLGVR